MNNRSLKRKRATPSRVNNVKPDCAEQLPVDFDYVRPSEISAIYQSLVDGTNTNFI